MPDEPVVLLHGFAGAPAAWDAVIAAWPSPPPRFIAPALPGHGPLQARPGGGFADAVDALLDTLPPGRRHIVGYSLGGRMGLGLAARAPRRCVSLTLIGVNPGLDDDARAARRVQDEAWAQRLEAEGLSAFFDAWSRLPLFRTQSGLPDPIRKAQDVWRRDLDPVQLALAMRQLSLAGMPDYRPFLEHTSIPCQQVVGALDEKFRTIAEDIHRRTANDHRVVRLDVIPDAGHNVTLEQPAALAQTVDQFFRSLRSFRSHR